MSVLNCHLIKSSPRYEKWREILGSDEPPITNPTPFKTKLGTEITWVYELDVAKLTTDQRAKLVEFIVETFGVTSAQAEAALSTVGFPIRVVDVLVAVEGDVFALR